MLDQHNISQNYGRLILWHVLEYTWNMNNEQQVCKQLYEWAHILEYLWKIKLL
uniref:Uncharacterized protein n=1 Tax=Arundo donax TaxID=35708 RepID=A0A0A9BFW4_ARUDO